MKIPKQTNHIDLTTHKKSMICNQYQSIMKSHYLEITCRDITRTGIRGSAIKAALFTNGKSSKRIMARLSPVLWELVIWVIEWMVGVCARDRVRERNARPDTLRARITRIDAGGAPRNTGCPAAAARPVLSDSCFRGDWIFWFKGHADTYPANPRSTADSRRVALLCYSRAPCFEFTA